MRGTATRGVAYWTDGREERIIAVVGHTLVALNARTGARHRDFGTDGEVDLRQYDDHVVDTYSWTSPPVVTRDVVVVGSNSLRAKNRPAPGDIRGYDVRTGKRLWTFHTPPRGRDFGSDTWHNNSWESSGFTNSWAPFSADDELGYVYLPLKQPSGYSYGGSHPGDNLFGNSLVCLEAATGKRVWHFQTIHHDIWDYDLPAAPILLDVSVGGRVIKAVAQVSKIGFVYAFDRRTGQPIWPIEERPVPKGDVPGEWYPATQPFPTKPPPFDQQGVTVDDLIDFTPELRKEAIEILSRFRYGPIFTPPAARRHAARRDQRYDRHARHRQRVRAWRGRRPRNGHPLRPVEPLTVVCGDGQAAGPQIAGTVGQPAREQLLRGQAGGAPGPSDVQAALRPPRGDRHEQRGDRCGPFRTATVPAIIPPSGT